MYQVASIELCAWLGGLQEHKGPNSASFMTIEDVGKFLESKSNTMSISRILARQS